LTMTSSTSVNPSIWYKPLPPITPIFASDISAPHINLCAFVV
jgi:hypothetical protein